MKKKFQKKNYYSELLSLIISLDEFLVNKLHRYLGARLFMDLYTMLGTCHNKSTTGGRRTCGFIQKNFYSPYKKGQSSAKTHCENAKVFRGLCQHFMVCFSAC